MIIKIVCVELILAACYWLLASGQLPAASCQLPAALNE